VKSNANGAGVSAAADLAPSLPAAHAEVSSIAGKSTDAASSLNLFILSTEVRAII
jgi:hypothetical protein